MKITSFLAGVIAGLALSAAAGVVTLTSIDLKHHDAAGRTQHAVAHLNSIIQYRTTVYADYTSPTLSCNGFEP